MCGADRSAPRRAALYQSGVEKIGLKCRAPQVTLVVYRCLLDVLSANVLQRDLTLMIHNVPLVRRRE